MSGKSNTQYTIWGNDGDRPPLRVVPRDGIEFLLEQALSDPPCVQLTEVVFLLADGSAWPVPVGVWITLPADQAEAMLQVPLPEGLQWRRVGE